MFAKLPKSGDVHRDKISNCKRGQPGPPGGEREETTYPGVPRLRAQWGRVVTRVTGPRVPCAPPDSGLDPAPGGGPSWAGKTAIPGMPCRECACSREISRRGAGWFKTLFWFYGNRPSCCRTEHRRTDGQWGEAAGPWAGEPGTEARGPWGRAGGSVRPPSPRPAVRSPPRRSVVSLSGPQDPDLRRLCTGSR